MGRPPLTPNFETLAQEQPAQPGWTYHLVLDNAIWHKSRSLRWHHFQPVYLPPYSPDLNALSALLQHSHILKSQCRVSSDNF